MKFSNRNRTGIIVIIALGMLLIAASVYVIVRNNSSSMKMYELCKIIAVCDSQNNTGFTVEEGYWYTPYVDYVEEQGIISNIKATRYVKKSDINAIIKYYGWDIKFDKKATRKNILDFLFENIKTFEEQISISEVNAAVAGIYENTEVVNPRKVCTSEGNYTFTGINIDKYINCQIVMYVYSGEILAVKEKVSDDVWFKNVYINGYENEMLSINAYGIDLEYNAVIDGEVGNALADIELKKGKLKSVNIKKDTITGKVLSVGENSIEVEGYGKVLVDEGFILYDICEDYVLRNSKGIVVGYDLSEFTVAEGKIVGAVVNKELKADNIRVLIKTSGYSDILHESVQVTCENTFYIADNGKVTTYNAGDIVVFNENTLPVNERVKVYSENQTQIQLLNVKRSQGNPEYEGSIEILKVSEGYALINEVEIEKYLKRVVPSEMPVSFGVEALKVQAVCARSYAYRHIHSGGYPEYGAHVDDSTQYQVYNNTYESEESNEAIYCTKGQVLTYSDQIVQAYYYSTSCGVGTNISLWGGDAESHPMYESRDISQINRNIDYTIEENFRNFINTSYEQDYDSEFGYYRWSVMMDLQTFSDNFNEKLLEFSKKYPDRFSGVSEDGTITNDFVKDVGVIYEITVDERVAGGAAIYITVKGENGNVRVYSEHIIRNIFGNINADIETNNGVAHKDMLPSAFIIFDKISNGEGDYIKITGGGYGHGIGMSQNAVSVMVEKGMLYDEILEFFYPHTQIEYEAMN